jgi:AI-2 transport protein TqsA
MQMTAQRLPRVVVVLVAAAAFTITMAGAQAASGIIGPAFLALVLTITVHPLRARLRRFGLPDWLASTLMIVTTYLLLIGLILALIVSIGRLAVLVPTYGSKITANLDGVADQLQDLGVGQEQVSAVVSAFDFGSIAAAATDFLSSILSILSGLFFIATLLLFMAFDTTRTTQVLESMRIRRHYLVDALRNFAVGTRNYMAVSAGFGFIVAVIDGVALWALGVPGAFIWAVLAFVTNFIPNVGFVIGVIPPAIIGLLEGGPSLMLWVIILYSVINLVIQSVIQPRVVGDRVGLSATITFLSLVFWAWAIGPMGALLAVPLTLLTRALLVEADPDARWVLALISGHADPDDDPDDDPERADRKDDTPPAGAAEAAGAAGQA